MRRLRANRVVRLTRNREEGHVLNHRIRHRIGAATVAISLATMLGVVGLATTGAQAASHSDLVAIPRSVPLTTDHVVGHFTSARMAIEIALAPRNVAALSRELESTYTKGSADYHHWLTRGAFDLRYGPSTSARTAVSSYLKSRGLDALASGSPFFVRASGSSAAVSAAFHTTLNVYRNSRGVRYFQNSTAVRLPATISGSVFGVIGLTNSIREHTNLLRVPGARHVATNDPNAACETGYVTRQALYNAINDGAALPYGYGDGPGCTGLIPSQTNGLYGAPAGGANVKGQGATAAVFELAAYQQSDVAYWAHTFYGAGYIPPLHNILVDGGPLAPRCPAGDTCSTAAEGFNGDVEVDADIQMELTVAPDLRSLQVYEAPNDYSGQTELDLYSAIANQDTAATVSSSWGTCENDITAAYAEAENTIFEQMALQGQSVFNAAGDTGAFGCIRSDGTTIGVANTGDPADQPWVTSVGGTSFTYDNPGINDHPSYPNNNDEMVWNVDNLCNTSANEGGTTSSPDSGLFWCGATGAGNGGVSQWWGRPSYQFGAGVNNPYTTKGNGTTQCALAHIGTPCRETPDVSANADEFTGYAEYCTPPPAEYDAYSGCAQPPIGWFQIGGTSLSTPLWAALITDRDAYFGYRFGNLNAWAYALSASDGHAFFHDITGIGQSMNNNGLYPTTPGFDDSTGLGSPNFAAFITRRS
jgi:subtilase family serine protease